MAVTIPDVILSAYTYIDLFQKAGIPAGTTVIVQNKTNNDINLQIGKDMPANNSLDGVIIQPRQFLEVVTKSGEKLWARAVGAGRISIQIKD